MAATFHVIQTGMAGPGMAPSQDAILEPLEALGVGAGWVTDVVFSHHHPDHTLNAALFGGARFHDYWAIYQHDTWTSRDAEGFEVSPSVTLWSTPGHTREDITTIVRTDDEVIACTHLWWHEGGPAEDPRGTDQAAIAAGRARVLEVASLVVPGHGGPFRPVDATPR